ncbi:MAG: Clp protease N-terminal domain-containing protein [Acidimicrobiales bacterium]
MSRDLTATAFEEARNLGHGWVGTEHFLLALLAVQSVAVDALNSLGVDYERVADQLRNTELDPDFPALRYDPEKGLSGPNPAGHQLMGRAAGLALAWGRATPSPEDWLVAMIYSAACVASLLSTLDVTQEAVLAALRDRGVRVPDVEPPRHKPWCEGSEVEVSAHRLGTILRLLNERHPAGSEQRWGFNWLPKRPGYAVVTGEEGIDLDGIVAAAAADESPAPDSSP